MHLLELLKLNCEIVPDEKIELPDDSLIYRVKNFYGDFSFSPPADFLNSFTLINRFSEYLNTRMIQRLFQHRVLFPYYGIPTPDTYTFKEFEEKPFWPCFFKGDDVSQYLREENEFNVYLGELGITHDDLMDDLLRDGVVIQKYVPSATRTASHLRIHYNFHYSGSVMAGAVIMYVPEDNPTEKRSNHRHGSNIIAITGEGKNSVLTPYEEEILSVWEINPGNRKIPGQALNYLHEIRPEGISVIDLWNEIMQKNVGVDFYKSDSREMLCTELQISPVLSCIIEANAIIQNI